MAYARRDIVGGAATTTLSSSIASGDLTIPITSSSGWPTAANGNFYVVIDQGNASEEKVLCSGRTGLNLAVATRGVDGTSAASHSSGAAISHCLTATDLDEANYMVSQLAKVTTSQDILVASGAAAYNRLAKGSNGTYLQVIAGSLAYAALATGSVDSTQLVANAVTKAAIAASSRYKEVIFAKQGTLTTGTGTFRWYPPANATLVDAWASVGTAPTTSSIICDINRTGTTIFTTQGRRPTISASGFYGASGTPDGTVALTAGTDYVTVDIDQIGSGVAGADLTVGIRYYDT